MRVVNYDASRVTSLFPFEEVAPLSGANDREIIDAVADRYKFLKTPDLAKDDIAKDGYKFASGQFMFESSAFRLSDFSIYRDGLVINAATTNGSEAFLNDVIKFMRESFSFRDFVTKPRLFFQSQLVVEFDRPPEKLLRSLDQIEEIISKPLRETYGEEIRMQFSRLDFDVDRSPGKVPVGRLVQRFGIERRTEIPFEKQRFFCVAPMRTDTHIAALEAIETLID
jgi:hypothetical protein